MNLRAWKVFVVSTYERIIAVAVMLVLVIFSIILVLRVNSLDQQLQQEIDARPAKKRVKLLDPAEFEKRLALLEIPPGWKYPEVVWNDPIEVKVSQRLFVAPVMKELEPGRLKIWDRKLGEEALTPEGFPYGWLHKYKLRTNVEVSHTDPDQDGFTVREEFEKQTNPQDPQSRPDLALKLRWQRVEPRRFPFIFNGVFEDNIGLKFYLVRLDRRDAIYYVRQNEIVPDKDYPGYRVLRYEKKTSKEVDPTIKDASGKPYILKRETEELVLQKGKDAPIVLTKLKPKDTDDLIVKFVFLLDDILDIPEQTLNSTFIMQTYKYEVLSIKRVDALNSEVIIKRIDTGETFVIPRLSSDEEKTVPSRLSSVGEK